MPGARLSVVAAYRRCPVREATHGIKRHRPLCRSDFLPLVCCDASEHIWNIPLLCDSITVACQTHIAPWRTLFVLFDTLFIAGRSRKAVHSLRT
jgi:hypothetical protein